MVGEVTRSKITECVDFVKAHVKADYNIDIAGLPFRILDGYARALPQQGSQPGLYLGSKIGERPYKTLNGVTEDKIVLIGTSGEWGAEAAGTQYFGVVFHEFGHASFDTLGLNCEQGAFTVEFTCTVAAVLKNLISLGEAQSYMDTRKTFPGVMGNLRNISGGEKALKWPSSWEVRASSCRQWLLNKQQSMINYPFQLH